MLSLSTPKRHASLEEATAYYSLVNRIDLLTRRARSLRQEAAYKEQSARIDRALAIKLDRDRAELMAILGN